MLAVFADPECIRIQEANKSLSKKKDFVEMDGPSGGPQSFPRTSKSLVSHFDQVKKPVEFFITTCS
jgi:hypothetical protein